ncbi:hypothetical protein [Roseateles sp.]|nr:hypothetical protein [Roseateles sp.]
MKPAIKNAMIPALLAFTVRAAIAQNGRTAPQMAAAKPATAPAGPSKT